MPAKETSDLSQRPLRAGMVGGGRGAFIGAVHRIAVELDGQARLVAGALSSDPQVARASAAEWFLERSYASYEEMARTEAARVGNRLSKSSTDATSSHTWSEPDSLI